MSKLQESQPLRIWPECDKLSRQDAATAIRQDVAKRIPLTIHRSEASGAAVMPRWNLTLFLVDLDRQLGTEHTTNIAGSTDR